MASNLLGNAVRHGDRSQPIRVRLNGGSPSEVVLSIANTGTIPPELLPHLFDPFRSGRVQAGPDAGLGIGLYIVQQIVVAHGGRVDVESPPGRDTVFRVTLPRRDAAATRESTRAPANDAAAPPAQT